MQSARTTMEIMSRPRDFTSTKPTQKRMSSRSRLADHAHEEHEADEREHVGEDLEDVGDLGRHHSVDKLGDEVLAPKKLMRRIGKKRSTKLVIWPIDRDAAAA
jgi:hypothetical protein